MAKECALLIPAYKAATIVPETIEAALKVFPPEVSNHFRNTPHALTAFPEYLRHRQRQLAHAARQHRGCL
jgi:hypothetical protein